jgi:sugar phosphate permease
MNPELRSWRRRVFAATWLSYAGFYFCRKPFFIAKPALSEELGWDPVMLGYIGTAYLVAYAIGQFIAGWAGNKWGPRILLLVGMAVSVAANAGFGLSNSAGTFMALMVLNGLAQATGWSGNVGSMAPWFRRRERGTVMGVWATNYQVGGVLANTLAAWMLGHWGLQSSFFCGSVVLLGVWFFFLFNQRNRPEDVGLPSLDDEDEDGNSRAADGVSAEEGWSRQVWINVLLIGVFYFFVKFIRYSLWSWSPLLLRRDFGLDLDDAGYLSTAFDLAGIAGVIAAGWLSDRFFNGRRARISFLFIIGMAASCLMLYLLGPSSLVLFGISIALVGFFLYGPDALMTGAAAIEVGSLRSATLAAGIINGMGAVGSVAQELILGRMLGAGEGVAEVFALLLISSVSAALALSVLLWRGRRGEADL